MIPLLSLLKLIFKVIEFQQILKFGIFLKAQFLNLASSTDSVLKVFHIEERQHLIRVFTFLYQNLLRFGLPIDFQDDKKQKKNFQTI